MVFSSAIFLFLFLPVVVGLYYVIHPRLRNFLLLVSSMIFYSWGEPPWVILAAILLNYFGGLAVHHARERGHAKGIVKSILALFVIANLLLLGFYKYANFFAENINALFSLMGKAPVLNIGPIALPLGISFFVFQAMSYTIDVYRKTARVEKNPLDFAMYVSLFPQLIAGPIVRYQTIADEIEERYVTLTDMASGVRRFVIGLGKKLLLANTLAIPADAIFDIPGDKLTASVAWLGLICYWLQLYFDFSAYSDMAIGMGRMFGFHFLENFNYPYISRSVTEFWTRWHISLSTWLRDYLFQPLGGYRVARWRMYFNLFIVFVLCGLWHGAAWTFVIWGAFLGIVQVMERMVSFRKWEHRLGPLANVYAMFTIMMSIVMFRSATMSYAGQFYQSLFGFGTATTAEYNVPMLMTNELLIVLVAGLIGCTPWLQTLRKKLAGSTVAPQPGEQIGTSFLEKLLPVGKVAFVMFILLASSMKLAAGTHNPFIYFRF